jgi:hypothetical protein
MPNDHKKGDEVGFGKPPKHAQFRKGVSGNPKGGPKGKLNLATMLERALQEKIVINENGVQRTVTKLEAAAKQLVNKAASGDLVAMRQLAALAASAEDQTVAAPASKQLVEADRKVMEGVLKRFGNVEGGEHEDH